MSVKSGLWMLHTFCNDIKNTSVFVSWTHFAYTYIYENKENLLHDDPSTNCEL